MSFIKVYVIITSVRFCYQVTISVFCQLCMFFSLNWTVVIPNMCKLTIY